MAKVLVLLFGVCLVACITGCPSPTPEGNPEAGQAVYDQRCAECHTLAGYNDEPTGDGPFGGDITGSQDLLTAAYVTEHLGVEVTAQEAADLRAFVAAQSE